MLTLPCPKCCDLNPSSRERCRSCNAFLRLFRTKALTRCVYCGKRTYRGDGVCPAHVDVARYEESRV